MFQTQAVFIEGLPGAGKTTIAGWLAKTLLDHNIPAALFDELDLKCPVKSDADNGLTHNSFWYENSFKKIDWDVFKTFAEGSKEVQIYESKIWQNYLFFLFLAGVSRKEIIHTAEAMYRKIMPLSPVLIYLKQDHVSDQIRQLFDEKYKILCESNYARENNISDVVGVIRLFEEWAFLCNDFYDLFFGYKTAIHDYRHHSEESGVILKNFLDI